MVPTAESQKYCVSVDSMSGCVLHNHWCLSCVRGLQLYHSVGIVSVEMLGARTLMEWKQTYNSVNRWKCSAHSHNTQHKHIHNEYNT